MRKADGPLQIRYIDPASLRLNEQNPRLMPPEEMAALKRSLAKWGFVDPIIVRRENGQVIGGHQRIAAAVELGIATVPVVEVDVSEIDALLLNLALNRIAGRWDEGRLALVTDGLRLAGADLSLTGFTDAELLGFAGPKPGLTDPDAVPEVPEPISKLGDLWVCGDATKAEDVGRLMAGEKAALMVTDPPYGVAYETDGKNPRWRKDGRPIANDDLGEDQAGFWTSAFVGWPLDGDAYIFSPSGPLISTLAMALGAAGIEHHQWLIWAKQQFALGRSHYHYRHEHIFYGWRGKSSWNGSRTEDSVWEADRPMASPEHPTMKPVVLCERAITNSSKPDANVVDPFLGSGTTMIACERLGRRCYGMEIEPRYVDVAVKRWEQFTGREAERFEKGAETA